jgi:hypothetical protein
MSVIYPHPYPLPEREREKDPLCPERRGWLEPHTRMSIVKLVECWLIGREEWIAIECCQEAR